jgi:hypothetical protein
MMNSDTLDHIIKKYYTSHSEPNIFRTGCCAEFSTALSLFISEQCPNEHMEYTIIYRIEKDEFTNEIIEKVISHVVLCVFENEFDIQGKDAFNQWMQHCDDNVTPWSKSAYNVYEHTNIAFITSNCPPIELRMILCQEAILHREDEYLAVLLDLKDIYKEMRLKKLT